MYRTGDRARLLPNGEIEFLGRTDFQVKIRGLRVELGEIEHALTDQPQIDAALVQLREVRPGTSMLTAYIVAPEAGASLEPALRRALAARLPAYMVPDVFVSLDALPLTGNGKVDRAALPAPHAAEAPSLSPRTDAERRLAEIWKTLLNLPAIGIDQNFFGAGGDSIRSTQMVALARREGFTFSVRDVLGTPTIAALATLGNTQAAVPERAFTEPEPDGREIPLLPMQRWFFSMNPAPLRFHQGIELRSADRLNAGALEAALHDLVERHGALRLRFPVGAGGERRQVTVAATMAELTLTRTEATGAALDEVVAGCLRRFDPESGPLAAALLIDDPSDPRLLLVAHHLTIDAVSWRVLLSDLETAYRARSSGAVPAFSGPVAEYAAWARAALTFASTSALDSEALYWLAEDWSRTSPRLHEIGAGAREPSAGTHEVVFEVPLENVPFATGPAESLEALLLATLAAALDERAPLHNLRLDLEGHGREPIDGAPDPTAVVGWCTALYPVLLQIEGTSLAERAASVERSLADVPAGGRAFGLGHALSPRARLREAALGRIAPAEILFNYLGAVDALSAPGSLFSATPADARLLRDPSDRPALSARTQRLARRAAPARELAIRPAHDRRRLGRPPRRSLGRAAASESVPADPNAARLALPLATAARFRSVRTATHR